VFAIMHEHVFAVKTQLELRCERLAPPQGVPAQDAASADLDARLTASRVRSEAEPASDEDGDDRHEDDQHRDHVRDRQCETPGQQLVLVAHDHVSQVPIRPLRETGCEEGPFS
jgi:hypothetical protein